MKCENKNLPNSQNSLKISNPLDTIFYLNYSYIALYKTKTKNLHEKDFENKKKLKICLEGISVQLR